MRVVSIQWKRAMRGDREGEKKCMLCIDKTAILFSSSLNNSFFEFRESIILHTNQVNS